MFLNGIAKKYNLLFYFHKFIYTNLVSLLGSVVVALYYFFYVLARPGFKGG